MPTVTPLAERSCGRSGTSHRAARHPLLPSPCRARSTIGSRSFPTTSSRWVRRLRRRGRVRPDGASAVGDRPKSGGKRALLFDRLDPCRHDAVSFGGDGSGYDDTVVAPQTLILIFRSFREIDDHALAN